MIQVVITTYNRPNEFRALIQNLAKQETDLPIQLLVMDDFCTPNYASGILHEEWKGKAQVHRFHKNQGKRAFWKVFNTAFSKLEKSLCAYTIFMPDDFLPVDGFFPELIRQFNAIPDPKKACLSYFYAQQMRNRSNWTRVTPRLFEHVHRTQWVDGAFIATRQMFEALMWEMKPISQSRWRVAPHLGSGVGDQMSNRLLTAGLNMYHVDKSLVTIQEVPSQMNNEIRKNHPLTP